MTLQATRIEDDDFGGTLPATTSTAEAEAVDVEQRSMTVRDVLRLLEANRRLQGTLATNAALCEATLVQLLGGADPGAVLDGVDVARARLDLAQSMAEFERARHQTRGTFISAQFEHGMNMKEISRRWAISRQLAHRFFKEARRDS